MEAQGPDVDLELEKRHIHDLSSLENYISLKNLEAERERLAKCGCDDETIDKYINGRIQMRESRLTFQEPKFFRIDADLIDSYKRDVYNFELDGDLLYKKTMRERVSSACTKVVGMSLDLYIHKFASDQGYSILRNIQSVVNYHMQMVVDCQKHGFYEPYIPDVLTMIHFGKAFTTNPGEGVVCRDHSCSNSPMVYLRIMSFFGEGYKTFTIPPDCMANEKGLVMKFDPNLLIAETKWMRKWGKLNLSTYPLHFVDSTIPVYDAVINAAKELLDNR